MKTYLHVLVFLSAEKLLYEIRTFYKFRVLISKTCVPWTRTRERAKDETNKQDSFLLWRDWLNSLGKSKYVAQRN